MGGSSHRKLYNNDFGPSASCSSRDSPGGQPRRLSHMSKPNQYSNAELPIVAIVGRPNVGKSTLFNRIVASRRAIVGDETGITRDRLYGDADWNGHRFRVVDTGGILPEEKDLIPAEIFRQARVALEESAAMIMVVDGRSELAGPDLEL